MKTAQLAYVLSGCLFASVASADPYYHSEKTVDYRYVKVIDADPVYGERYRDRDCRYRSRSEYHYRSDGDAAAGAIVGGVIGAAVGSNAGNHRGDNVAGAAVGAVIGGVIGAGIASDGHVHYDRYYDCERRHSSRRDIIGYDVSFLMDGERYQVFSYHNPGRRMKVKVTIEVAE